MEDDSKTRQEKRKTFDAGDIMQALMPVTAAMLKPIAKTMIKMGIMAYEMGKTTWDELSEEARAELARSRERRAETATGQNPLRDVEPEAPGARRQRNPDQTTEV
jgi:polyhydroxyalkanoate synthesis regulator phasin